MSAGPTQIRAKLQTALEDAGLDLFQHFSVGQYNEQAAFDARLPDFGRGNAWGFLVGNSRALWRVFLRHRAASPRLREAPHPLDLYVTEAITRCVEQVGGARFELVFAHALEPRPFPIQRLAEQIGFAQLAPSHLAAHPLLGPWFGLRAVGVLDLEAEEAGSVTPARASRPCGGCSAPCLAAFERAFAQGDPMPTPAAIAARPEPWIAIREACPVGMQFRYGRHQLAYHYTGAPSELQPDELGDEPPPETHGS